MYMYIHICITCQTLQSTILRHAVRRVRGCQRVKTQRNRKKKSSKVRERERKKTRSKERESVCERREAELSTCLPLLFSLTLSTFRESTCKRICGHFQKLSGRDCRRAAFETVKKKCAYSLYIYKERERGREREAARERGKIVAERGREREEGRGSVRERENYIHYQHSHNQNRRHVYFEQQR